MWRKWIAAHSARIWKTKQARPKWQPSILHLVDFILLSCMAAFRLSPYRFHLTLLDILHSASISFPFFFSNVLDIYLWIQFWIFFFRSHLSHQIYHVSFLLIFAVFVRMFLELKYKLQLQLMERKSCIKTKNGILLIFLAILHWS